MHRSYSFIIVSIKRPILVSLKNPRHPCLGIYNVRFLQLSDLLLYRLTEITLTIGRYHLYRRAYELRLL